MLIERGGRKWSWPLKLTLCPFLVSLFAKKAAQSLLKSQTRACITKSLTVSNWSHSLFHYHSIGLFRCVPQSLDPTFGQKEFPKAEASCTTLVPYASPWGVPILGPLANLQQIKASPIRCLGRHRMISQIQGFRIFTIFIKRCFVVIASWCEGWACSTEICATMVLRTGRKPIRI